MTTTETGKHVRRMAFQNMTAAAPATMLMPTAISALGAIQAAMAAAPLSSLKDEPVGAAEPDVLEEPWVEVRLPVEVEPNPDEEELCQYNDQHIVFPKWHKT
jgi:hypothetical protein